MTKARDMAYLAEALRLARRGEGGTRPNPPVGAVLVRGTRIVGRGLHARAGGPHAEILALRQAGKLARGATLYVTLEPCCTRGRTGPCTEAVVAAGIARVVACVKDPNPAHAGRGLARLRRAGVAVEVGLWAEAASALIAPFAKWITGGRSYLTLKLAASLDGRIADRRKRSRWISSAAARAQVQSLRKRADAVLVGVGTVLADNPALACRTRRRLPLLRVIADSRGRLPLKARVLCDGNGANTIVATTARCPAARQDAYRRMGAQVWVLPAARGRVSLPALMRRLGRSGILHVVCEGGGELAAGLVRERCADALWLFLAPKLLGGGGLPAVGGAGWPLAEAPEVVLESVERVGPDLLVKATFKGRSRGAQAGQALRRGQANAAWG